MAKFSIQRGSTNVIFHVFALDSTSTSGAGKASIAYSSWSCRYIRDGETLSGAITPEDISTLGTYAAPTANTNIRIKAVDNTNAVGVYEVQIHNDWVNVTNSCRSLVILLTASGVAPIPIEIELTGVSLQDGVRGGMTALPNAAAEASGGLYTRGSGAGQINQDANGRIDVNVAAISADATAADNAEAMFDGTGYAGGTIKLGVDAVAISGDSAAADNLEAACDGNTYNVGGGAVVAASVTGAVGSVTGAVGSVTGNVGGNVAGSVGSVTGAVGSVTGDVGGNVVGSVASVTAPVTAGTVSDKTGYSLSAAGIQAVWDALSSALTTVGSIGKRLVDYIDATISSRSTYAGGDTSGTTTLLSRIPGTVAAQSGDSYARLGAPAGASLAADVASVKTDTQDIQSRIPAALSGGRIPAVLATTPAIAGDAMALTTAERASVADKILGRNLAGGSDTGRTVAQALAVLRNRVVITPTGETTGTMTVYAENDSDVLWIGAVTLTADASPVTAVDPT